MRITKLEPMLAGSRYLFVKIYTDEGITGIGECGAWGYQEAAAKALKQMEQLLLNKDPMRIEFIWNALSRNLHFRGSIIQSAISGIDLALWDIKGKALGVPCYELLGGMTREKILVYVNAIGHTPEEIGESAQKNVEMGFRAIRLNLFHQEGENGRSNETFSQQVEYAARVMEKVRQYVGWNVDVAVECHRGFRVSEAIEIGRAIQSYRPYFYEDPVPDNPETMPQIIEQCQVPVATGERFINLTEFETLLSRSKVRYIRPDLCLAGGLTAGKKIAALAEARGIQLIPHNPLGPVSTAACLQLDASIPNFEIQEYPMYNGICRLDQEMKEPFSVRDGYLMLPQKPGLGVELIENIGERFPFKGVFGGIHLHEDGSVVDR